MVSAVEDRPVGSRKLSLSKHQDAKDFSAELPCALAHALGAGASAGKIRLTRTHSLECAFEAGRLKSVSSNEAARYGVEVLRGMRRARAWCSMPTDLDGVVEKAVALAEQGSAAHFERFPAASEFVSVPMYSPRTAALTRVDLTDAAAEMVEALRAYDAELFVEARGRRAETEEALLTSGGVRYSGRASVWSLSATAQRTRDADMLFVWFGRSWRERNELFDPAAIAAHIIECLRLAERTVVTPEGKLPAILAPELTRRLLDPLFLGVNGKNVVKGSSPLRGRLGEQIFAESVTVLDNPHADFVPGAREVDGDGVPTRVNEVVRDGAPAGFLYDYDTAMQAGAEPTGNNGCRPYAPEIPAGTRSSGELIGAIRDGLYIKQGLGFGQSNMMNGDLSFNVGLGYRVQGGEVVGRVKNTMVSANIYELLAGNVEFSSNRDPVLRMPYTLVDGVHVSGAG